FDQKECGLSVKELYLTSFLDEPFISLNHEYKYFRFDDLEAFLQKFRYYMVYRSRFQLTKHSWSERKTFKDYQISDLKKIEGVLNEIPEFNEKLVSEVKPVLGANISFAQCEEYLIQENKIRELAALIDDPAVYNYFSHMVE